MATTIVIARPPYGSEGPYNALRLADLLLRGDRVLSF
jgi:sulfur relay (sulfurtransferase) complex TusBCD TusD component (DsrE family)